LYGLNFQPTAASCAGLERRSGGVQMSERNAGMPMPAEVQAIHDRGFARWATEDVARA
jgi:hypothetical protein